MQVSRFRFKALLRWLVLGAVLFFLLKTLKDHWQEVASLQIDLAGFACLAVAIGITLLAHVFAGYVWAWILSSLSHKVSGEWGARAYLKTNIAKYLPGNIWHFYGRISAATKIKIPLEAATLSVLLEPLLMAAAACIVALIGIQQLGVPYRRLVYLLQFVTPIVVLCCVHPLLLNPLLQKVSKLKKNAIDLNVPQVRRYPFVPLLGEIGFLGLRSLGFIFTFQVMTPVSWDHFPLLIGAFAWAWLLGFIIPGLPGGVGVFETVAIVLLERHFPAGQVLGVVALYRFVNMIAEGMGAGLVVLDEKRAG